MRKKKKSPQYQSKKSVQQKAPLSRLTPQQLKETGNISAAIRLLRSSLQQSPNDEQRRLLGHYLFEEKEFGDAALIWLSLDDKKTDDITNIGLAFYYAEDWDQAIVYFEASLAQEKQVRIFYLLAQAHLKENRFWGDGSIETRHIQIDLLQQARLLPDCTPEVYIRLAHIQSSLHVDDTSGETRRAAKQEECALLKRHSHAILII